MDLELCSGLTGKKQEKWATFLQQAGLDPMETVEKTALLWDGEELVATGSRQDHILKCIAVDPFRQGEGLTATVLTALRQDAFAAGHRHLFLYTKPQNHYMFSSLFFHPVAQTDRVLLMEDRKNGIETFLDTMPKEEHTGTVGAAVMNCNPFTKGHRYLVETAAGECDHLYIFVLSEDKSLFPAADRLELVRRGTADLKNVTVLPTGPYLISSATFPTYFLPDRDHTGTIQCRLDIEIFLKYYVPRFGITRRYVGTEPLSPLTDQYNQALKEGLTGVELRELPRLEHPGGPISATTVRSLLKTGQPEALRALIPETTYNYLEVHDLI